MIGRLFGSTSRASPGAAAERRFLNVGGGDKAIPVPPHFAGWTHHLLDIFERPGVDVVCDARKLETFPPAQYDAIYCSHNLEHYYRHDVAGVLRGFAHVLKSDGFAEVRVPDVPALMQQVVKAGGDLDSIAYESPSGPVTAHDMLWGYGPELQSSGRDFYAHKCGFTRESLARALNEAGFEQVFAVPPLSALEIHVIAFRRTPSPEQLARFDARVDG